MNKTVFIDIIFIRVGEKKMFDMDIGIDLGTANVLVFVKGKGIVINQPSVVAFEKKTKRLIAIGNKAKHMGQN